jgi:alcohol dehydrogenase
MLPSVVRWNASVAGERYAELLKLSSTSTSTATASAGNSESPGGDSAERLAQRLEELATAGGLRRTLGDAGVPRSDLSMLANEAAEQWTGRFNPRAFDSKGALEVYGLAF